MENSKVERKYRIFDAKTGIEKNGRYFVLRCDSPDVNERMAVVKALEEYCKFHREHGRLEYAESVLEYLNNAAFPI